MSCGCSTCEDNLIIDPIVLNEGEDGLDGNYGGFSGDWLFETNTGTPPSTTKLRVNNASLASVTELYIDKTNASNIDYEAFLLSFSADGLIKISKEFNSSVFWMGSITSVTDSGTYVTIVVTTILSNGSFSANNRLIVSYTPAIPGTNSVETLYNDVNTVANSTNSTGYVTIFTHSIPALTLPTNGDRLAIRLCFRLAAAFGDPPSYFKIKFNGANFSATLVDFEMIYGRQFATVDIDFTRESNVQASIDLRSFLRDGYYNLHPQHGTLELLNAFTFNTNPFDITVEAKVGVGTDILYLDRVQIVKYLM